MTGLDILDLLLGDRSVCHGVCSDLLARSLVILSCVETSLSGKVDLGVEGTSVIKPSVFISEN